MVIVAECDGTALWTSRKQFWIEKRWRGGRAQRAPQTRTHHNNKFLEHRPRHQLPSIKSPWGEVRHGVQHHHAALMRAQWNRDAKRRADTQQLSDGRQRVSPGVYLRVVHLFVFFVQNHQDRCVDRCLFWSGCCFRCLLGCVPIAYGCCLCCLAW